MAIVEILDRVVRRGDVREDIKGESIDGDDLEDRAERQSQSSEEVDKEKELTLHFLRRRVYMG